MQYSRIAELYDDLRVSDVRDGMDWIGLFNKGTVDRAVRPVFDGARVAGPALTVRLAASHVQAPPLSPEEYTEWARNYWYKEMHIEPYVGDIRQGDVIVIEAPDLGVGQLGSWNTLNFYCNGAQGVVTTGGVRDTDECRLQGVPIFAQFISQSMTQGRIEYIEHGVPITVGGVRVNPDDLVVADGDGVIVVPEDRIADVAQYARQEAVNDKKGRRRMYERLGWQLDHTVQEPPE